VLRKWSARPRVRTSLHEFSGLSTIYCGVVQLYCPALELIQQMQVYQRNYRKYEGNIEESCRASASHYVALGELYARIVDNITNSSRCAAPPRLGRRVIPVIYKTLEQRSQSTPH